MLLLSFEIMICFKKVNYLLRKYDLVVRKYKNNQRKVIVCLGNMISSFDHMSFPRNQLFVSEI